MRYRLLSSSWLIGLLLCPLGYAHFHPRHKENATFITYHIKCPVVKGAALSTGETLDYDGHRWKVRLYSFGDNLISTVDKNCLILDSTGEVVKITDKSNKNDHKTTAIVGKKTKKPFAIKCLNKGRESLVYGYSVPAKKIKINTPKDMTYSCYVSQLFRANTYCQGYVKPSISKGKLSLNSKQYESEIHYKFFLEGADDMKCTCEVGNVVSCQKVVQN